MPGYSPDASKAHRLRKRVAEGKPLAQEDADWLAEYNRINPPKQLPPPATAAGPASPPAAEPRPPAPPPEGTPTAAAPPPGPAAVASSVPGSGAPPPSALPPLSPGGPGPGAVPGAAPAPGQAGAAPAGPPGPGAATPPTGPNASSMLAGFIAGMYGMGMKGLSKIVETRGWPSLDNVKIPAHMQQYVPEEMKGKPISIVDTVLVPACQRMAERYLPTVTMEDADAIILAAGTGYTVGAWYLTRPKPEKKPNADKKPESKPAEETRAETTGDKPALPPVDTTDTPPPGKGSNGFA